MKKIDCLQKLDRLLKSRHQPVAKATLSEKLECCPRTVQRYLDELRVWGAPLEYDEAANGWYYNTEMKDRFELPGIWLTSGELQSLALLLELLKQVGGGFMVDEAEAINEPLDKLLSNSGISRADFEHVVKVCPTHITRLDNRVLTAICASTLERHQIQFLYVTYDNRRDTRTVSPQRLVYYRENWYLDGYCHDRENIRTFHLSRVDNVKPLQVPAKHVPKERLQAHFEAGYGIFAGEAKHTAVLRFFGNTARDMAIRSLPHRQFRKSTLYEA